MRAVSRPLPAPGGRPWRTTLSYFLAICLLQILLLPAAEAKDEPTITVTDFDHSPININYFKGSDTVLFQDPETGSIWRSTDAGAKWAKVDEIGDGKAYGLVMHEFEPTRAYVLTTGSTHWKTHDRGKTWDTFFTDSKLSRVDYRTEWLRFHASDPDRILFHAMDCPAIFCDELVMYTLDGFKTDAKFLRGGVKDCWWAKSTDLFTTTNADLDNSRTICIVMGEFSFFHQDNRLLISDNYFSAVGHDGASNGVVQEFEPKIDGANVVRGIANLAVVKKHLLVATNAKNTDEMALYVTDDTEKWHRAVFPSDHTLNQGAYTVLEGTNYSIQIDVMTGRPSNPVGVMLTSNSNGTYFTKNVEHTNRNARGHVDFEKISGIQGIFMVNQVHNWKNVEKDLKAKKELTTKITFDDGRTFESVKEGDNELHLHSVTEPNNVGRIFSSPAPGLVMGNGNEGKYLGDYLNEASLYVSDDAGKTWIKGPKGPHKYEFGDQGSILLAVHDSLKDDVGELKYSLNHGKDWKSLALPDKRKIRPFFLTTTQDSTSLRFILTGESESGSKASPKYHIFAINFEGMHEATCKESDMEEWYARKNDKNEPTCVMGHKQKFHRRKKDAECFIKKEFKMPLPEPEICECADADFECDFNFVRNDKGECVKAGPVVSPKGACKKGDPDETFKGSSGYRLIPGNDCKRKGGAQKDDAKEWKCSEATSTPSGPPANGKISNTQVAIKGEFDKFDKHYLERGDGSDNKSETIIMRPYKASNGKGGPIMITHDHGKKWETPKRLKDADVWSITGHQYVKEMVFFISHKKEIIYTTDWGVTFSEFEVPTPPDLRKDARPPLAFHPDNKNWLIWHGLKCPSGDKDHCHLEASVSFDRGDRWATAARFVKKCEFIGVSAYEGFGRGNPKEMICIKKAQENNDPSTPNQLVWSNDAFEFEHKVLQENVKEFATMAEFIVVASENQTAKTLMASASVDGKKFAEAKFPYGFEVPHQHAYTVLDSSTHAVNLFVETQDEKHRKFGSILKSNSGGTSYVMSVAGVNCDENYFVDFEKMLGLQGVVLVNVVQNQNGDSSERKRLQSKISHNDGAVWSFLPPPKQDLDGKSFACSPSDQGNENCALHIHGYTERLDHKKTYSSESAVGIMFGWGNVGPILGEVKDADTFMTTDAGISWKMVKKGRWIWTFGDQGSIIVLAQRETRTKTVSYTLDEGKTWVEHPFSDKETVINDLTTLRSGSSRNFLLWGHQGDQLLTINLDFTGLTDKACRVDKDMDKSDYSIWTPAHPKEPDGCLFGHKTHYLRKKPDRQCFNEQTLHHTYSSDICSCKREDFECNYNYEMDSHGQCKKVEGLPDIQLEQYCKENPNATEFYADTEYRRIPLTNCKGGLELDRQGDPQPCPGHEEEFEKAHGVSGVAIFFAVIIPIGIAAAVGWWVYNNWQSKFGQIRLGEQNSFDQEAPWVKYPVIAVSAVVAVVGALPLLASSLWRSGVSFVQKVSGRGDSGGGAYSWLRGSGGPRRFTTRDSFARGRSDYAIVDEDEGELLGDDSDEEV
ncbi:Tyrosine-protein phosphatase 1 [Apiospora arundinis]|uniref:Vacuolar protein sorting/targeting protein 10 n=1 Tax=Apiospora arundinis TaxID=335852 RepID=A0ABR2J6Q1_9PEZI